MFVKLSYICHQKQTGTYRANGMKGEGKVQKLKRCHTSNQKHEEFTRRQLSHECITCMEYQLFNRINIQDIGKYFEIRVIDHIWCEQRLNDL